MIQYGTSLDGIGADMLAGFFVGWPNPPSAETHLKLLKNSADVVMAVDDETGNVVGFMTAISDGVLSAHIPYLEVLPAYQGQGIGRELFRRMLESLSGLYMVDLICDPKMQGFYEQSGMKPALGMMIRNYDRQSGT